MTDKTSTGQTVFATLRYRDTAAAIEFLTKAFGFTEVAAYRDDTGQVMHAQLAYGPTSVMLGQARDSEYDQLLAGSGPNALYVVVADIYPHFATARAAGADIVQEPFAQEWGSVDYIARDPEGNIWSFGTYGGAVG